MIYHKLDDLADLPRRPHHHMFDSAYYPTYAAAARRFRELTGQEPTQVYEYQAPTPIGKAQYTTWFIEVTHENNH